MATQVSTKVRLVRCPKCRQVLAELPEVLVYKCGGCGTILQAKNRKIEPNHTELSSQETHSAAKSQHDNVSEETRAISSKHDSISPHKVEALVDNNNISYQDINEGSNMELCEDTSISDGISSSPEIKSTSIEGKEPFEHDKGKSSGQNSEKRDSKFHDHENSSEHEDQDHGLDSSPEMASHENEIISKSAEQSIEVDCDDIEGLPTFRSSSPEKTTSVNLEDSKSLVSFYLSSPDEFPAQKLTRNFERVSSVDTLGSLPVTEATNFPRTASYYAYDGSESSYDGTIEDHNFEHISHHSSKYKHPDFISGNNVVKSEPEMNYWAKNSRGALKTRDISGNRVRLDEQGVFSSRTQFTSRIASPSRYRPDLLPPKPVFHSEPDKMELLRTVCELKEQLNQMHFPEASRNRNFAREYDPPRHHVKPNFPRMAFSGEVNAHYRHHQDRRYSAQLPSNCTNCSNGHCRGSEKLHSRDDENEMRRLYLKEKYNNTAAAKRHLRPVAGGAPVVVCYHCSELLQIPADFLLFKKRRYHRLKCNACRKVLKFAVMKKTHIVPYFPDDSAPPPPSEAENEFNNRDYVKRCSSSFDGVDRKMKSVMRESRDKNESSVGVGRLSKIPKSRKKASSEIESLNSPLHRLMGYTSPSQVLNK